MNACVQYKIILCLVLLFINSCKTFYNHTFLSLIKICFWLSLTKVRQFPTKAISMKYLLVYLFLLLELNRFLNSKLLIYYLILDLKKNYKNNVKDL